ncbi:protein fem-1 homolog B-like [Saccoglossus kowalevskii]|uniref:Protein fem-1 homolog B n=1 Tax=Saccoglossus kowalevskii TaxID=10224 RepID=A0ABM0GT20_SACKO|nr:PREDICTED: protein fem-1 homolog B-like [Saccoglossus kowalevskii]
MAKTVKSVGERVFNAARDGKVITLGDLLHDKSSNDVNNLLSEVHEHGGQKCTPLVIASRNGHNSVVKLLLEQYKADAEQEGIVKFNGYIIEGASALWCAAGAGHFAVVETLVDHGANVNHTTATNSTPLRAACFDGRLDIVTYLVERSADINIANKYDNTCLMIASYKGHTLVVKYLLEHGASPDVSAHCGATALHFSAECGHLEIVKLLVEHGATMSTNEHNMTPLMVACESNQAEVAKFLINPERCSKADRVKGLELLGASYANDKDNYSIHKTYHYLRLAMLERFVDPNCIIEKEIIDTIPAYEKRSESRNLRELEMKKDDPHALHLEALIIRERILGPNNPEIPHPIIYRGAVCADNMQFDKCISLWMRAMKLKQANRRSIQKDILRFAQVFSQMLHIGERVPYADMFEVVQCGVTEIDYGQQRIKGCVGKDIDLEDSANYVAIYENNVHIMLYLFSIVSQMTCTIQEDVSFHKQAYRLIRLAPRLSDLSTLLHLVVNHNTPVDDFHTNDVCKFPNASLVKLFIECGANPDEIDINGNSPLHIIVKYDKPISDFLNLHCCIMSLLNAGAHIDRVNKEGKTPMQVSTTGVSEIILKTQTKISLKCFAARAVKMHEIPYKGCVPKQLEQFIEIH